MKIVLMGGEDVHSRIEIAKKFIGMGFDIEILGTEDEDRFIKNGIHYRRYNFNREFGVLDDIKTLSSLREILKSYLNGTVVHGI